MSGNDTPPADGERTGKKLLSPAARRALDEAKARRLAEESAAAAEPRPKEFLGREGPEPTRYGDWEHKGLISDF